MAIFNKVPDLKHFIKVMRYYQIEGPKPRFSYFNPNKNFINSSGKIVNITCFCLMPNHFHLLLEQVKDGGISEFIGKLSNSYTKYFNKKNKRIGPLFQGEFKAVHIQTDEQLIHVSRYIHLNPLVNYITKAIEIYPWSSYPEYLEKTDKYICKKEVVLSHFKTREDYKQFVLDQEDYGKKLEKIKHQLLDNNQ